MGSLPTAINNSLILTHPVFYHRSGSTYLGFYHDKLSGRLHLRWELLHLNTPVLDNQIKKKDKDEEDDEDNDEEDDEEEEMEVVVEKFHSLGMTMQVFEISLKPPVGTFQTGKKLKLYKCLYCTAQWTISQELYIIQHDWLI